MINEIIDLIFSDNSMIIIAVLSLIISLFTMLQVRNKFK